MNLKHVDILSAMRALAERRIEEAMREGKFDNLKGAGQPLNLDDMPADEATRMTWWMLRVMKHNGFIPDEVRMRKALDFLRARLLTLGDETALPGLVAQINELVHKINTLGTNALSAPVVCVDLEAERDALRLRCAARNRPRLS